MNQKDELYTDRMIISPMTDGELEELIAYYQETVPELSLAYQEMLTNCIDNPNERLWYTSWKFCKCNSKEIVGYAGFKGIDSNGMTEIGYGVNEGFEGFGYATEAVSAILDWACKQPRIKTIEAEAAADNIASLKVLKKIGFLPTGGIGVEGPRFILHKE